MTTHSNAKNNKLVALASIAAELHSVMTVAWSVSLAAKNAKVISAQSGDKGLGFQPITDFIDEVSEVAMQGVNDINDEALRLTKVAVNEQRCIDAFERFESVKRKNQDAQFIASMNPALEQVEKNMIDSKIVFKKGLNQLTTFLESMDECMLSARAIASVSRIVTSNAQEYRDKLKVVADDLDKAASYIKGKITGSYDHLCNIQVNSRKQA